MYERSELPLVDCHVHMRGMASLENLSGVLRECEYDAMNVLSIALRGDRGVSLNVLGLLFKLMHPGAVYAFGGLRHPESGDIVETLPYAEQARRLMKVGCDGIKLIEGKPTTRKMLDRPLDSPGYDPFYSYLEKESVPLLFHVNDPESFWDPDRVSPGARAKGWFYGDGTFPSREQIYGEAENVLRRHPNLRVVFAHFYFLSAELDRLETFLAEHPTVCVDITPNSEMYVHFTAQRERARQFFIDHADRILFGTDISGGREPEPDLGRRERERVWNMCRFLETDDEFTWWGMDLKGLGLPRAALEAVCAGNFRRWAGREPAPVPLDAAMGECGRLMIAAEEAGKKAVFSELKSIRERFRRLASEAS